MNNHNSNFLTEKQLTANEKYELERDELLGIQISLEKFLEIYKKVPKWEFNIVVNGQPHQHSTVNKSKKLIRLLDPWGGFKYSFEDIEEIRIDRQAYCNLESQKGE